MRDWLESANEVFGESHERTEAQETFDTLRASLSESVIGRLPVALWALYGQQSAEELLEAIRELLRPQDQIFVLGNWLRRNPTNSDAPRIVNEALDRILLHSDTVMPDAQAFRDIAEPLPSMTDPNEAARLVGRFDRFTDLIERQSPSSDFVRLQMWLARAECRYDADRASTRLLQVWFSVSERADLVERAACVAQVVAALDPIVETARAAGQNSPLSVDEVEEIKASLDPLVDELLATCADQYHATRGVIRALAPCHHRGRWTLRESSTHMAVALPRRLTCCASRSDDSARRPSRRQLMFWTKGSCSCRAVFKAMASFFG